MVYRGRPSTGCGKCRERKIKVGASISVLDFKSAVILFYGDIFSY